MPNTVKQPEWAANILRLDPGLFPQQITYKQAGSDEAVSITMDERGAYLRRTLPSSGLPLTIALPYRVFKGVAARAIDHGDGEVTVTLELHHADPGLCIPLLVAHDLYDIAADWRGWSDACGLPMLMVEADGVARELDEHLVGTSIAKPMRPRRRHSYFAQRRPRFLVRRKTGSLGVTMKIQGREIFARD
jgi:hypothetical protein